MSEGAGREDAYLLKFGAALRRMKVAGAREIVVDVKGHIAEAMETGRSLEQALTALGPPEALARAYAVELALSNPRARPAGLLSVARIALLLAGASVISAIVAPSLALLAFTFLATGLLSFVFAAIELLIVDLPFIQNSHFSPIEALAASIPIFAVGCLFAWLLWRYLRYLVRSLRRMIPAGPPPA